MDNTAEAERRINHCHKTNSETLDLGGLGLDLHPNNPLWEKIFELNWLKHLYLGLSAEARQKPYWNVTYQDKKACNAFRALHGTFASALPQLEQLDLAFTSVEDLASLKNLTSLTTLNLGNTQVSELVPLKGLTSLTTLDLTSTQVSELAPLKDLTSLTDLNLERTQVSGLAPLKDMASLTDLNLERTQVSELVPLKDLTNLTTLNLRNTPVSELAPLKDLTGLTTIDLWNTQVSELAPLKDLTSLTTLDLASTQVSELAPLKDLTSLTTLDLTSTQVSELAPLKDLTSLTTLYLTSTPVSELASLKDLSSLTNLNLAGTQVSELTPLKDLTSLTTLYLSRTPVSELSPLKDLTGLTNLNLAGTPVSELAPLKDLTGLINLDLARTQISELAPLKDLTNLTTLTLESTPIRELPPLKDLTSLTTLDLESTQIRELAPLKNLPQITDLNFRDTPVSELGPLKALTSLATLDLGKTQVSELAPLKDLANLTELNLQSTPVSKLAPLKDLTSLTILDLWNTQVSELAPIKDLTNLTNLYLENTSVRELGPLKDLTNLTTLDLWNTQVSELAPLKNLTSLTTLDLEGTPVRELGPLKNLTSLTTLTCSHCHLDKDFRNIWFMPSLKETILEHTRLPGVPAELLSESHDDNCLPLLRAYFNDLDAGKEPVKDVKLIILGNGRIGKTQIRRRLAGEDFDGTIKSTHGIQIATAPLSQGDEETALRLQIWDFGGQDIYHGTHALFLRSQAMFMAVWTPDMENQNEYELDGHRFRNHLLPYWVNYVRQGAGKEAPLIITQTRCEKKEDEQHHAIPQDMLTDFTYSPPSIHYSAKTNRKRGTLDDELWEAAQWLREKQGISNLPAGWAKVKHKLEEMRDQDLQLDQEQRQHRTLTKAYFLTLSNEETGIADPEIVLQYLHDIGTLFYNADLFNNEIILDQQWVLEAIYAVLDRDYSYARLKQQNGRFTKSDLGYLLWDDKGYSPEEQDLFLSFMQSCNICFVHRKEGREKGSEAEYIAPDLLPEKLDQYSNAVWNEDLHTETSRFKYPLLFPGLMRSIIARIGTEAGLSGDYWRNGVQVYDAETKSFARIEQHLNQGDNSGSITIRTQRGNEKELLNKLRQLVAKEETKFGVTETETEIRQHALSRREITFDFTRLPEQEAEPKKEPEYFVSYGRKDDTDPKRETIVDALCNEAKNRKIEIFRDIEHIPKGASIKNFMNRMKDGDHVIVVLSHKYLRSRYCMEELLSI